MKNIKKVVLSTVASGFLVSALASSWIGEIENPNVNGECPAGFSHFDLNDNQIIDIAECWSGTYQITSSVTATFEINGNAKFTNGIVQEDWTTATLLNQWRAYSNNADYIPASFKDSQGMVHIKGFLIKPDIHVSSKILFVLPEEHWPEHFMYFTVAIAGSDSINVYVETNGTVSISSYPGNEIPLNGLSFRAAN